MSLQPSSLPSFISPVPEQTFLAKHYDENSKKPDRDPRGAFRNPTESTSAGIVGPMGSSSFNLPNVERALTEMETGGLSASVSGDSMRRSTNRATTRPAGLSTLSAAGSPGGPVGRGPTSPTMGTAPSPSGGQTQHEVLQNFFQSLLSSKDRAGASAAARNSLPKTNGNTSGTEDTG